MSKWTADVRVGCVVVYEGEPTEGCIENGRRRLAYFSGIRGKEGWEVSPQDVIDARLIAAAPELLEALKNSIRLFHKKYENEPYRDYPEPSERKDSYFKALAAIAKAEGKP